MNYQEIRKAQREISERFIKENISEEYFLGGSTRFGYASPESDFDFFVCLEKSSPRFEFNMILSGFTKIPIDSETYTVIITKQYKVYNTHINIIPNYKNYSILKRDHVFLEEFMERNHCLIYTALQLKTKFSGAEVYRLLQQIRISCL